jgi:serine/threonine protein kinase
VGQAAEQIIAGVVLSERLAVTMYGAIHRAQFSGQRNLRGLVVDPKILAESSFRIALTDSAVIATALALDDPHIVPTVAVESGGSDVVIVTRGVGRYVTVQDLITAARANRGQGGRLPTPIAAAIGRSVIEALAAAHKARVVHGAVHPRSVLIDEDGGVKLGDFIVGRALTTAVAQGADAALWRGLAGYLAPELVVGEDPAPGGDVFAVGALLFAMLSGEAPPGNLHATPAVERLVQRALDTDATRRYRSASDLLENLLEAFEDDRWDIADRSEVIHAAGLSHSDSNIDEATEDLLASLGSSPSAVQVAPIRPSVDIRAQSVAAHHAQSSGAHRLDALLADLDDGHTAVDQRPYARDPISEVIARDPRRSEAIVQAKPRVPSLDDPDDDTPLPPPSPTSRDSDAEIPHRPRGSRGDEVAAMTALAELDDPGHRAATDRDEAEPRGRSVRSGAEKAARAADRGSGAAPRPAARPPAAVPLVDVPQIDELPPVRLRSRAVGIVALLVVVAGIVAIIAIYKNQQDASAAQRERDEQARKDAEERTRQLVKAQPDLGAIAVTATPSEASVWLKLGRTTLDSIPLSSNQLHRLRIELDGYQPIDTEVVAASWEGSGEARKAKVAVTLKAVAIDPRTKRPAVQKLPALPPNLAAQGGFSPGEGPIHIETSPPGAEVWLLIGYANTGVRFPTIAGRAYELRTLADGYKPGYASITADEWRDPTGDPKAPIDMAKKHPAVDKHIDLEVDPEAPKPKQGK